MQSRTFPRDAATFGTGVARLYVDGATEHIDYADFVLPTPTPSAPQGELRGRAAELSDFQREQYKNLPLWAKCLVNSLIAEVDRLRPPLGGTAGATVDFVLCEACPMPAACRSKAKCLSTIGPRTHAAPPAQSVEHPLAIYQRETQQPIETMRRVIDNRNNGYPTDRDCIAGIINAAMKLLAADVKVRRELDRLTSRTAVLGARTLAEAFFTSRFSDMWNDDDVNELVALITRLHSPAPVEGPK